MENVMLVVLLCCCVLITPGTADQPARKMRIENCNEPYIDILANANNTILCIGFHPNDTIVWTFKRDGEYSEKVATCGPSSYCTVPKPDHFAVERSPSHSTLFYHQYDRNARALVYCERLLADGTKSSCCTVCTLNVTNASRPISTRGTTPATSSPDLSSSTNNANYTSPKTQEENDLPVGAIVGGTVAVVAVIIVVMVVVVVCVRRKRKQKPAGTAHWSGNGTATDKDDFEEHVNPMYGTSEDLDDTHTTDHKPSAIALRLSPNSHNGHPAASHSLEADMYTTVDDEARFVPSSAAHMLGGYENTGFGSNGSKRVPQTDEYAAVDKSRAQKGPASSVNTRVSSPAHTTEGSDEYAVVDKSLSRNKATKNVASGLSDAATSNACAQVEKSAKKVKVAEPEAERAAYVQVQKPKSAAKPKTSATPTSNKDVTRRGTADDDEYHTLSHTRGSPHTQDQADLESRYSHIGHD